MKRGLGIGNLFLCFFSYFWLHAGVELLQPRNARRWSTGVLTLCLGMAALSFRYVMEKPASPTRPEVRKRINKVFGWVNAVQWTAIFLAIAVLNHIHREQMILLAISVIVAVHFFPLAALFRRPSYHLVGAAILIVDAAAFAFPDPLRSGIVCIGTGAILLSGAAYNLLSIRSLPLHKAQA